MPNLDYGTLTDSRLSLQKLAQLDLPIKVALKVKNAYRSLKAPLETFDELLMEIQKKHAVRNPDGSIQHPTNADGSTNAQLITIPPGKLADYNREVKELRSATCEISYETIKIDDLGADIKIPGGVLADLHWLLV